MQKNIKSIFSFYLFLFVLSIGFWDIAYAQYNKTRIYHQDFENAVVGTDFLMSAVGVCLDENKQFIGVIDSQNAIQLKANGGNINVTNIQGRYFFSAEDIDGTECGTPAADDIDAMYIRNIDIKGYTDLELRIMIAESDDGGSQDYDRDDFFHINGRIDSDSEQNLIWVEMDSANASDLDARPLLDTNFNGEGDGAEITNVFTTYSADIEGTGDEFDITFFFHLNRANEDIAFDEIEIYGNPPAVISGDAGWRLLSFPESGGSISDISDNIHIQGVTGGIAPNSTPNFFTYDSTGTFNQPTNVNSSLGNGYGFGLYFFDKDSLNSTELPDTLTFTGESSSSDVSVTLNSGATNKYTLVGNPFASNFNTKEITATGGNISDNIAFWNDFSSSYSTQDRTAIGATSGYIILPWQGFWVETADASVTSITFPYSGTTLSNRDRSFYKESQLRGDIFFTFKSDESNDEAIRLSFREYATLEYDRADASKLTPLVAEYATMAFKSDAQLKSVESLPYNLSEEVTIAMEETLVGISGEFTFDWSGLESIPSDWGLTFHDYEAGVNVNMREMTEYKFDAATSANEKVNPLNMLTGPAAIPQKSKSEGTRFGITITPGTTSVSNEPGSEIESFALEQNYPNPFNPTTTINYSVENSGVVTLSVYNLMGQKVAELVNETKSAGSYNVTWNASQAASGMYYYRLEAGGQVLTRKMTLIK